MPKIRNGDGDPQDVKTGKISKYGRRAAGRVGNTVQLDNEHAEAVVACINAVSAAGDAIMFSSTTGGGIVAITVYSNGHKPEKLYCRDADEIAVTLADIENAARDATA